MTDNYEFLERDGFKVCSYETSRFKTAVISFNMVLPFCGNISAHALLPYVLNRSCREYPTYLELNRKLSENYGASLYPSVTKAGENHVISLTMEMIDNRFALEGEDIAVNLTDLLCKLVFEPNLTGQAFSPADVEREKRLALERLENQKNDKKAYSLRRAVEIMCEGEPYRINEFGSREEIESLTPEALYEAWHEVLKTARIQVNVVGTASAEAVEEKVLSYLSKIERDPCDIVKCNVVTRADKVKKVTEEQRVKQSKLVLGFRAGMEYSDQDYPVYKVMTDIFGGGTYSRLFSNVRERMSLCYYCSAGLRTKKGLVLVQSGIEAENAEKAVEAITAQLADMAAGNVTDDDIANSQRSLADGFNSVFDYPGAIDSWAFAQITDDEFLMPSDYIEKFNAVTKEQVIEKAGKMSLDTIFLLKGTDAGEEDELGD